MNTLMGPSRIPSRHGVALVLLGWYLLLPPDVGKPLPDTSLPFSMWKQSGAFASEEVCLAARKQAIADYEIRRAENEKMPGNPRRGWNEFHHARVYRSACIASDDALLNAK